MINGDRAQPLRLAVALRARLARGTASLMLGLLAPVAAIGHAGQPVRAVAPAPVPLPAPPAARPLLSLHAVAQIELLQRLRPSRLAARAKLDSGLHLALLRQRGDARLAALPKLRTVRPDGDGRIAVDLAIRRAADLPAVLHQLQALGAPLPGGHDAATDPISLRTRLRLDDLDALARLPGIRGIRRAARPYTAAANRSEGVQTHGVDLALAQFGADGFGERVCALSDGIDSLAAAQASGDLPADVLVLPGQAGTGDEGTAMLEVIHDLAPRAALGYASAFAGPAQFAQNIRDLAAAGCTVIVDDVLYLDESPWQDGPIAQAVNAVTAAGVSYVSSAGNEGNRRDGTSGTWEGDFRASAQALPAPLPAGGARHDFGDGGQSLRIERGASDVVLIWAEHYTLSQGFAATDYDLYVLDGDLGDVVAFSNDVQDGVGGDDFPVESLGAVEAGQRVVVIRAGGPGGPPPPFHLSVFRGEVDDALATAGSTRGHSTAAAAYSVTATPAAAPFSAVTPAGPFPGLFTGAAAVEVFSSDGPRRLLLDSAGNRLTPGNFRYAGGIVRAKPDLAAADGVSTTVPGFTTFYGSSAAAPHAAAIAALVRGAVPGLAAASLRNALAGSALDIAAPGADANSGAGVVMAVPALSAAGAAPQSRLVVTGLRPMPVSGDGDNALEPGETWSLALDLVNDGRLSAGDIEARLSSPTAGVVLVDDRIALPDLAAGASASSSALRFRLDPAFPCGRPAELVVTVQYDGRLSPAQGRHREFTGASGTPLRRSYGGPAVAIPDGGGAVSAALTVSGLTTPVRAVALSIDGSACTAAPGATTVGIDHGWVGDLVVELVGPRGDRALALDRAGGAGNGGRNLCQVVLDDSLGGPDIQGIASDDAPFAGTYTPRTPLAGALGSSADGNGSWSLRVRDAASGADSGSIRAWSLNLTPAICDAGSVTPSAPTVTSVTRSGSSPTGAASAAYTVRFSEPVRGVDVSDFRLARDGSATGSVAAVSGSGSLWTVTVGGLGGDGRIRLDVVDDDSIVSVASGVPLAAAFAAGEIYTLDHTAPVATVAIAAGQPDPVTASPVRFAITLSELSAELDSADLIVGGSAGASRVALVGSGLAYEATVTGMTGNGTVTLQVRAGAFSDTAGNASLLSNLGSARYGGFLPIVGFTQAAQSVVEGSGAGSTTATITATLSAPSDVVVTVPVTLGIASTATVPDDYRLSALGFSFPAGSTVATITAIIVRDGVEEPDETVVLQLGTPTGATLGSPATQTLTVTNDDDGTPTPFAFAPVAAATPGSTVTSAPVVIDGINQPVPVTISGGSYSINGAPFTSAAGSLVNGQPVRVRLVASSQPTTAVAATLTVGSSSARFTVTTAAADPVPDAFSFAPATGVAPGSVQTSAPITVAGINTAVAISISGGRYRINGGDYTTADGTVVAGDTVSVQQTASAAFATTTTATLDIGGVSAGYAVTTAATPEAPATSGGGGAAGGSLLVAGLLVALHRRRRRSR